MQRPQRKMVIISRQSYQLSKTLLYLNLLFLNTIVISNKNGKLYILKPSYSKKQLSQFFIKITIFIGVVLLLLTNLCYFSCSYFHLTNIASLLRNSIRYIFPLIFLAQSAQNSKVRELNQPKSRYFFQSQKAKALIGKCFEN